MTAFFEPAPVRPGGVDPSAGAIEGALGIALVLVSFGCTELRLGEPPAPGDAGPRDASLDASFDASFDASLDASFDAGARDAGTDSGVVGMDAGRFDAGRFDAGVRDAGPFDSGPFDAGALDGGPGRLATDIAAGSAHTCIVDADGEVICWGSNSHGQLGVTGSGPGPYGIVRPAGMGIVSEVCAGTDFTCARTTGEKVWCWGAGAQGQLGSGTTDSLIPLDVNLSRARSIACGEEHACALVVEASGNVAVHCWGSNAVGQLGIGDTGAGPFPETAVSPALSTPAALGVGSRHGCASTGGSTGTTRCWGDNGSGQVTSSTTSLFRSPVPSVNASTTVRGAFDQYSGGDSFTCGLASPTVSCWGGLEIVSSAVWVEVEAGGRHVCVRSGASGGGVRCWGDNSAYQLGDATPVDAGVDIAMVSHPMLGAETLSAGDAHTCVVRTTGRVMCWGDNGSGQSNPSGASSPVMTPTLLTLTP